MNNNENSLIKTTNVKFQVKMNMQKKVFTELFKIQTLNKHFKLYFCHLQGISNSVLTIVNYSGNMLILKNGIFFDLLKSCLFNINAEINNRNLIKILTQLTVHYHNY